MILGPEAWLGQPSGLVRLVAAGVAGYASLVLLLRVSGKRTLSKLNAFDLVITVALGSTLSAVLTSGSLPILQGIAALALLVALQFVVTWTCLRWRAFDRLVKSEPTVLLRGGEPLAHALRRERVSPEELMSAVREAGGEHLWQADIVILETDGSLTAVLAGDPRPPPRRPAQAAHPTRR